jgi:hypothetical protein
MEIVSATSNFDFKTATLADPQPLTGQAGFYFTQLTVGPENKSLYLQLPECVSKQGVVNIKNTKYLDLMFERDTHDELMRWVEKLEYNCQDIIDSKKELWFQTELTRDDIETMMTQITRLYQSGKYVLMRVFVEANKTGQKCIAYDENEIGFDLDTLEANKTIIPLVMIEGVKFSSRSFEISLKLVQVMVMGRDEKKSSCLIKRPNNAPIPVDVPVPLAVPVPVAVAVPVAAPMRGTLTSTATATAPILEKKIINPVKTIKPALVKPTTIQSSQPIKSVTLVEKGVTKPILREKSIVNNTNLGERTLKPIIRNTIVANNTVANNTAAINNPINLVKKNDIEEITINYQDLSDTISLKNPNEVYYEIYKNARNKAKLCRIKAMEAYLEAKQIKTKYMLQDLDDSDDSDDEIYNEDSEDYQ